MKRLYSFFRIWMFWLLFFALCRLVFILYNFPLIKSIPFFEILKTFYYGLSLDLAFSAYIMILISVLFVLTIFFSGNYLKWIIHPINGLFIVVLTFAAIADVELYRNWGYRMDNTVLFYLQTPQMAMASTTLKMKIFLFLIWASVLSLVIVGYKKFVAVKVNKLKNDKWYFVFVYLFLAAFMIIPGRGGVGHATINQSAAYFSTHQIANHTATNVFWNFFQSLTLENVNKDVQLIPNEAIEPNLVFNNCETTDTLKLLNVENPNLVIIVLESFTANVIGPLGGNPDITPNFNKLTNEGILFSKFYANGNRSDKGLVSIFSGYHAQPTTSIISYGNKIDKLSHMCLKLKEKNYNSSFYYGGDLNFAKLKAYFKSGGFEKLVTKEDIHLLGNKSKWGYYDHVMFDRFNNDLNEKQQPFFSGLFTLSSHEPFDVPYTSKFNGKDENSMFFNSLNYTDSCIGDFISKAKKSNWWSNSLIVFVADHGNRFPGKYTNYQPERYHIPMLWLGGALSKTDTVISKYMSQVDIVKILGTQMNFSTDEFYFGKDPLSTSCSYATYVFKNGFCIINDSSTYIYSIKSDKDIRAENLDDNFKVQSKAWAQFLLNDFENK